jgi:hypothetical protein
MIPTGILAVETPPNCADHTFGLPYIAFMHSRSHRVAFKRFNTARVFENLCKRTPAEYQ